MTLWGGGLQFDTRQAQWQTIELVVDRGTGHDMGLVIETELGELGDDNEPGVWIAGLPTDGKIPDLDLLSVGDRLVSVDGVPVVPGDVRGPRLSELNRGAGPVRLVLQRPPHCTRRLLEVTLDKGPGGFGFSIDSMVGCDGEKLIAVQSVASEDLGLQVMDFLLAANGCPLSGLGCEEAMGHLRSRLDRLTLLVERFEPLAIEFTQVIELRRPVKCLLGFSVAGGCDSPVEQNDPYVYVTQVIPGALADQDGRLRVGDRIVEINGTPLPPTITHERAVALILASAQGVTMRITRLPDNFGDGVFV